MTAEAASAYEHLTASLLRNRAAGTLTDKEDDAVLMDLDAIWRQMTAEERNAAEERLKKARQATAPKSLGLIDVPVEEGESHLPRKEE